MVSENVLTSHILIKIGIDQPKTMGHGNDTFFAKRL